MTGQDHEEAVAHISDLEQRLARGIGADLAKPADPFDLRRLQRKEHLGALRIGA